MDLSFLRLKKRDDAPPAEDEHKLNLGADATSAQSASGGVAAHTTSAARENAARLAADAPGRRGRPRKDASPVGGNQRDLQAEVDKAIASQLDALHDPKQWEALLCFPADTALTLTGRDHWKSSTREREVVGATGSALARTLMITNPRALAAMMCAAAMINFYMPRAMLELKHLRDEKKAATPPKEEPKK